MFIPRRQQMPDCPALLLELLSTRVSPTNYFDQSWKLSVHCCFQLSRWHPSPAGPGGRQGDVKALERAVATGLAVSY